MTPRDDEDAIRREIAPAGCLVCCIACVIACVVVLPWLF
jgi:hypothetical protein